MKISFSSLHNPDILEKNIVIPPRNICSINYSIYAKYFTDSRSTMFKNCCPQWQLLVSGSPIIQDGKLVGAVTHVLVNGPTTGYGIFIENMLDATA